MTRRSRSDNRQWTDRRTLATVVRVAVLGGPLLMAVLVVQSLHSFVLVHQSWPLAANLLVMAIAAFAAGAITERATRRLLPLPGLLRMSMLFPDRAPSRLKVAKLGSSTKQLEKLLVEGRQEGHGRNAGEVVLGLVTALTQHDRRTRGHSERVRMYADLLANEMGMTSHDRDRLRWAALLHDVGKLKIAPKVLNKPVALTEDEWQRMRMHPLWGAELAEPLMSWLGEWGKGIAEHHEKFDGHGYPLGLWGEEISQSGRMVAVIDAFETMTAARPYKQPMATATARAELARCAGTHFDPIVVRAFLGVSLPRLLWAMGPLALVVHLPYLRELQLASSQLSASANATAASASTVAASTALAVTAVVVPSTVAPADAPSTMTVQQQSMTAATVRDVAPVAPAHVSPAHVSPAQALPAPVETPDSRHPVAVVVTPEPPRSTATPTPAPPAPAPPAPAPTASAPTASSPTVVPDPDPTSAEPAPERLVRSAATPPPPAPAADPAPPKPPAPKPPAPEPAAEPPGPKPAPDPPAPPAPRPPPVDDDDDDDDDDRDRDRDDEDDDDD